MAASDKKLKLQLMEAGTRLVEPPSSVDKLIPLLDKMASCLSRVEQSPSKAMQNALSPALKALVAEQLMRHPDNDVKVAVAACISEITRITASVAPYDDDQMRDVFQLIVSSFENFSDKSSRSFDKRVSILETVAKVRLCVVMLDLECKALIIEMFRHFLKSIRDHHSETISASMATIMTIVLEESEDSSVEFLSPILASVKRDNEEVLPAAWGLAEKVLENCGSTLKPYLMQAVQNSGISLDDYSSVIASICQVAPGAVVDQNDIVAEKCEDDDNVENQEQPRLNEKFNDKSKSKGSPLDKATQDDGCDFFRWIESRDERQISGTQGNVMEDLIVENMLLKENRSLMMENVSLKGKMRRHSEMISKTNRIVFLYKISIIVSWMVFLLYLWSQLP